ncbi:MAG: transcription elongation factor GreA [Chloroflexi bacterium]|nr:transcription elongation factor GreA [Chloroflexota bacterium]
MAQKQVFLTSEGLAKLAAELEHLQTVRRHEVAQRIQQAKELAGTANNAEYEDAKNEQAFVEGRILTLETILKNATIIPAGKPHPNVVQIGSSVTVLAQDGEEEHYIIVGSAEANPRLGKISNESPVGRGLLGKRVGDEIEVQAPGGPLKLTVMAIG